MMRQCRWAVFWDVQQQSAAHRHVQKLHAGADAEYRLSPIGNHPHQPAIEKLAPLSKWADCRVEHPTITSGIKVGAPHENNAVYAIEDLLQVVVLIKRR